MTQIPDLIKLKREYNKITEGKNIYLKQIDNAK